MRLVNMERSTAGTKKIEVTEKNISPDGRTVARANSPQVLLLSEVVDELPNELNWHL